MRNLFIGILATSLSLGAAVSPAHAVCGQTLVTQAEQDLWDIHGCDTDFMTVTDKAAALSKSDWKDRGWDYTYCDPKYEYPKFWNSWYLVTYGIQQVPAPLNCSPGQIICLDIRERPWHDDGDYLPLVRAGVLPWHDYLKYQPSDDSKANYARYQTVSIPGSGIPVLGGFISGFGSMFVDTTPRIQLGCHAFDKTPSGDPPSYGATPSYRVGGGFVHESWHAWNGFYDRLKHGGANGHEETGPKGLCTQVNGACDHFRPHEHSAYKSGELYRAGSGGRTAISVYQVELEYLCDLSDNAATWMPYSVRESAANEAGHTAKNHFVETVPYWCGSTRPLWGARPAGSGTPDYCTDQNRTSCHAGCGTGICGNDGCCIKQCTTGTTCSANYTCVGSSYSCDITTGCCYYNVIP